MVQNESSRMHVRNMGELQPPSNHCAVCGNSTCEDGYIDPDVYFDYIGYIYFCMTCVSEMMEVMGLPSISEVEYRTQLATSQAEENKALKEKVANYEQQLRDYDNLIVGIRERNDPKRSGTASLLDLTGNVTESEASAANGKSSGGIVKPGTNAEPVVSKPGSSTGLSLAERLELGNFDL